MLEHGDSDGSVFEFNKDGFHSAINWFAAYYIIDPKARDTHVNVMKTHDSWQYKGDLEKKKT